MSTPLPPDARSAPTGLRRLFTPVNVILLLLVLGGVTAAAITQFGPSEQPRPRMVISPPPDAPGAPAAPQVTFNTNIEGVTQGAKLPLFASTPPTPGLPDPAPGTPIPVNKVDLFTGKAINFGSPTKTYKGYVVGFCCANSAGLNGGWDGLNDAEKDTYVRSFLK